MPGIRSGTLINSIVERPHNQPHHDLMATRIPVLTRDKANPSPEEFSIFPRAGYLASYIPHHTSIYLVHIILRSMYVQQP